MESPSSARTPWERLQQMLRSEAISFSNAERPILDRRGRPMRWIFYIWGISLSASGASLLAECLLDALKEFESVQVASVGMAGLPLVASIVARGSGRYSGLCVRPEQESWGTRRQVEGVADKSKPIVVVDDCICSGKSLMRAIAALEKEGYRVEGTVCVVNFPWKGGTEWARGLGYKVKTIFDIYADLEMWEYQSVPEYTIRDSRLDPAHRVPDGLEPADAARWVTAHFLASGRIPCAPKRLAGNYEARGGVMVSFRDRVSEYRVARGGFYHLHPEKADLCRDVVLATAKTLLSSQGAVAGYGFDKLKLAVTLFGEQVPIRPRQLDFSRFGVLLQSTVQPGKLAGALPNTQFFVSEMQQWRHARFTNAHLHPFEPFRMFQHTVKKSIELGCSWPSFGVSESRKSYPDTIGEQVIARVREVLASAQAEAKRPARKLPADIFPEPAGAIAVSLYHQGLIGCWISWESDPDAMIVEAALGALHDTRWKREANLHVAEVQIVVSVLRVAEELGAVTAAFAAHKLRLGKDSLAVRKKEQASILLAHTPCHYDWTKQRMAQQALDEAAISNGSCEWTTYLTQSWLGQSGRATLPLESGYPLRPDSSYRATAQLLANYILDKIGAGGLPEYCYYPVLDRSIVAGNAVRIILALESLFHASGYLADQTLRQAAISGLQSCCEHIGDKRGFMSLDLPGVICGAGADVFLINAVYRSGERRLIEMPPVQRLKERAQSFFHADGAISCRREGMRVHADHDLFPGFVLRMAASVAEVEGVGTLPRDLHKHLAWYQRRFQQLHPWGMVWWQIQGWAPICILAGEPSMAAFVYHVADWALAHQLDKNGSFLVDYYPAGPSFHTACVLEGIGEAWALARRIGDEQESTQYQKAWERGIRFIDRLIIREEDTFAMPKPARSVGGVRESLTSSRVRIDYVAHSLLALLKGGSQLEGINKEVPVSRRSCQDLDYFSGSIRA